MSDTIKLMRAWHFWSDIWLSSSMLFLLVAFVLMLSLLRVWIDPALSAWFEANGNWFVLGIHGLYIPLAWTWYCGHRMSKAKRAVDLCAADMARELDA